MKFKGTILGSETTDPKAWPALVKEAGPLPTVTKRRANCDEERKRVGHYGLVEVTKQMRPAGPYGHRIGNDCKNVDQYPYSAGVVLTAAEREWLGATVRRSDGLEGQVWSLAHSKPGRPAALWLVAAGVAHRADVCEVTLVQSRVDQLALDL